MLTLTPLPLPSPPYPNPNPHCYIFHPTMPPTMQHAACSLNSCLIFVYMLLLLLLLLLLFRRAYESFGYERHRSLNQCSAWLQRRSYGHFARPAFHYQVTIYHYRHRNHRNHRNMIPLRADRVFINPFIYNNILLC